MSIEVLEAPLQEGLSREQNTGPSKIEELQGRITTIADQLPSHRASTHDLKDVSEGLPATVDSVDAHVDESITAHQDKHEAVIKSEAESFKQFPKKAEEDAPPTVEALKADVARNFGVERLVPEVKQTGDPLRDLIVTGLTGNPYILNPQYQRLTATVKDQVSKRIGTVSKLLPKNFKERIAADQDNVGEAHDIDRETAVTSVRAEFLSKVEEELEALEAEVAAIASPRDVGRITLIKSKIFPEPSWVQSYPYTVGIDPRVRRLKDLTSNQGVRDTVRSSSWYKDEILPRKENLHRRRDILGGTVSEAKAQLSEKKLLAYMLKTLPNAADWTGAPASSKDAKRPKTAPEQEIEREFKGLSKEIGEKKALRKLSKKYHPDSSERSTDAQVEEKAKAVSSLYDKRKRQDRVK